MKFLSLAFLLIMVAFASARTCPAPTGISSTYTFATYNLGNGGFYEVGSFNIDFEGKRAASMFELYSDSNVYSGWVYEYAQNQTSYLLQADQNGNLKCYESPSSANFPSGYPAVINDVGPFRMGRFNVEMLEVDSGSPSLNQTVFFDLENCAPVSSYFANKDESNPGFGTMNFFNVQIPSESAFQLPQECYGVVGSSRPLVGSHQRRTTKDIPHPHSLYYQLNMFKF